jgi:ankyrin repeat protein
VQVGNGATALHAAVENGHLDCAVTLLRLGAKQTTAMQGASPLLIALQYRHPDIAIALLVHAARQARDAGAPASRAAELALVDAQTPHDGEFPLLVAVRAGYDDVVAALLALGARTDLTNRAGHTVLATAERYRRAAVVELLKSREMGAGAR